MSDFVYTRVIVARIRDLIAAGLTPPEIAREIGCLVSTLRWICRLHGVPLRPSSETEDAAPVRVGPRAWPASAWPLPTAGGDAHG